MDTSVLTPLLMQERARFVATARRRLPTEADAEDVVQRAMMRAIEHAVSLEDPARVGSWFGRILQRTIADFYRSRKPETPSDSGDVDVAAESPEPVAHGCACSLRLLGDLPAAYSDVLRRIDVDGESPQAVAATLSISPTNLHVRLHRARRALRERVKAHCGVVTSGPCLDCTCDTHGRCGDDQKDVMSRG
jgi:RNA polymerase sigma factor (sigma-70 family)